MSLYVLEIRRSLSGGVIPVTLKFVLWAGMHTLVAS